MSFIDDSDLRMLHEQSQLATSQLFKPSLLGFKAPQFPPAPTKAEQPVVPDASIFDHLSSVETSAPTHGIPNIGECAVHLELLEALLVLKTKILKSNSLDRAFGIPTPARGTKDFKKVRERKWKGYVALAVFRFKKWWENINKVLGRSARNGISSTGLVPEIGAATLPPLDVLMVWHTLMLNPELYRRTCQECPDVWKIRMPWTAIHGVIDASTRAYCLPSNASELFVSATGLQPDLFEFLADLSNLSEHARKILTLAEDRGISYAEYVTLKPGITSTSQDIMLQTYLNREEFALSRIKFDIKRYIAKPKGKPEQTFQEAFPQLHPSDESTIGTLIKDTYTTLTQVNQVKSLESFRSSLIKKLASSDFQKKNAVLVRTLLSTRALQKLLSSYAAGTQNNTTEIEAAIFRQGDFVEKMGSLLWIRSPALRGTLTRALSRYERFFQLLAAHPKSVIVPTLDIDLVWHTHQCSPALYAAHSQAVTGRFVNHDDQIEKTPLKDSLEETKSMYFGRFGEDYERCLCWDCEALLTAVEEVTDLEVGQEERLSARVAEDVAYFRAVEKARRDGKMLPVRRHGAL